MSIEAPADGKASLLYMEHFLCPTPNRGQIVVMDNLSVHELRRARDLIEKRGCSLVSLLSYSPDFNLMEEALSKIKAILTKARARTFKALVEVTGQALSAVTVEDDYRFFGHCEYRAPEAYSS